LRATSGLYVPAALPQLDADTIAGFAGRPYAEVAVRVIRPFVGDAIAEHDRPLTRGLRPFRHPAVAPLTQFGVSDHPRIIPWADARVQDLAMQLPCSAHGPDAHQSRGRTTIVVATSGDTGGAAIGAFRGRARVDLFVLFPQGRVSDVQRRMMTTAEEDNVHALAIEGTFDDCQAIVKSMFNHHAFRDQARLSGVNSINWARIVAQVVYYFTAAVALGAPRRKIAFTVPTGNFGDVYAGYVALGMGLPIDRLVVATNVNDILARTMATGIYDLHDVVATSSPSMDIQVASNFERLLFDAYGRDGGSVRRLMSSLEQSRRFALSERALSSMRAVFSADRADEEETAATIRTMLRETGHFIDPHTAVAVAVAEKDTRDPSIPMVVLGTAHPAKFPDAVEAACGVRPALPQWLANLDQRRERVTTLPVDPMAVERHILSRSRAAHEGAAA
jgi:threonine synthase